MQKLSRETETRKSGKSRIGINQGKKFIEWTLQQVKDYLRKGESSGRELNRNYLIWGEVKR